MQPQPCINSIGSVSMFPSTPFTLRMVQNVVRQRSRWARKIVTLTTIAVTAEAGRYVFLSPLACGRTLVRIRQSAAQKFLLSPLSTRSATVVPSDDAGNPPFMFSLSCRGHATRGRDQNMCTGPNRGPSSVWLGAHHDRVMVCLGIVCRTYVPSKDIP